MCSITIIRILVEGYFKTLSLLSKKMHTFYNTELDGKRNLNE